MHDTCQSAEERGDRRAEGGRDCDERTSREIARLQVENSNLKYKLVQKNQTIERLSRELCEAGRAKAAE